MTLDDLIKRYILHTLDRLPQREAAKYLGISDKTIRNYMDRWGISTERRTRRYDIKHELESYKSLSPEERDFFENLDSY